MFACFIRFVFLATIAGSTRERTDTNLLRELEVVLQPQLPVAQRCRTLRELCDSEKLNRLEDVGSRFVVVSRPNGSLLSLLLVQATIQKLWDLTKDLIEPNKPAEQRHIAFCFYQKLIQSQYEDLSLIREHFFKVIQCHDLPEDIQNRLDLLRILTENGKNIKNVDDRIGEFLLSWMPAIAEANLTQSFLEIVVNIIQFNAGYLDSKILARFIRCV